MDNQELAKEVSSNFFWRFAERFLAQLVSLAVSTLIARLLLPEDFGIVAFVNIFITFANVFVSSGLGTALIQKKDSDETDFSSVFYFNLILSIFLYLILFFLAPLISKSYNYDGLILVIRVMGLRLIVAAINTIQHAYVSKKMQFKKFFWSTLIGTIISGVVGVVLAYKGYGVWALVIQYMTNSTIDTIVLFVTVKWKPKMRFSLKRLKTLFPFGWKILASEIINTGYVEIRGVIIGLKYTSSDLAYYNKGQNFPKLIGVNIEASLSSVLFPAMSKHQEDLNTLKKVAKRSIRVSSYIIMPIMIGFALVAKPFVSILLTDKWLFCVPYLQLYCVFYAVRPLQNINLQLIKAIGKADIYLKQEILKKTIGLMLLFISIPFGPLWIAVTAVASNLLAIFITILPMKKLANYSIIEQIKDMLNNILPLVIMIACVIAITLLPISNVALILLQIAVGVLAYVVVSVICKNESFYYVMGHLKKLFKKTKKKNTV